VLEYLDTELGKFGIGQVGSTHEEADVLTRFRDHQSSQLRALGRPGSIAPARSFDAGIIGLAESTRLDDDFASRYGPWALVAGASEGIGEAFSQELAGRGLNLLLVARRVEPLERLADEIRDRHGIEVRSVSLDLASPDLAARGTALCDEFEVGLLVYNAAHAEIGEFLATSIESKLRTVDVNCRGPLVLASVFGERMVQRGRGGLVLLSSLAGFQGSALVTAYAASKAFDTVLAEGLWAEFAPHGVDVLAMVAGATSTPNFLSQTPENKRSSAFPMEPAAVAREALATLGRGPIRVAGRTNKLVNFVMSRLLSRRRAVSFMSRMTRRLYRGDG